MSLDIGEIGVRVHIRDARQDEEDQDDGDAPDAGARACAGDGAADRLTPLAQADIVQQCVRQVLQALRRESGR